MTERENGEFAGQPSKVEVFVDAVSELLEGGAAVFLDGLPSPAEGSGGSASAQDAQAWKDARGDEYAAAAESWVTQACAVYLAESAHLLRALSVLLQSKRVFATLDLLVRAVVERVGHVNWILDHRITSEQRAARAGLEYAACMFMYRESLSLLGADPQARAKIKVSAGMHKQNLNRWFSVVQPPEDQCDDASPQTGDVRRWIVQGENFPSLTDAAHYALESGSIAKVAAKGTYGGLSGFSHPNVVFSGEHLHIDETGRITFIYQQAEIEKLARMALFSYGDGVKHWVGYYLIDHTGVASQLNSLADRFEFLCTENSPTGTES